MAFHTYLLIAVFLTVGTTGLADTPAVVPTRLRCEYLSNPLAIESKQPRLFWVLRSEAAHRGAKQTAYQVLAASSAELLATDRGDLWDSGQTNSGETIHVEYQGKPLTSRQRVFWKVRVWDQNHQRSPWSEPAEWTMGLLDQSDWKARWIADPLMVEDATPGGTRILAERCPKPFRAGVRAPFTPLPVPMLRKEFSLSTSIRRAIVYATARGNYGLRLNGHRVGDHYLTPGWTEYNKRIHYQAYDVTDLLHRGDNVIAAMLSEGWYAGWYGSARVPNPYGLYPQLLAQLEIELTDGSRQIVVSNESWRSTLDGPIRASGHYVGEDFDGRRRLPGWDSPGFDDTGWLEVAVERELGNQRIEAQPNEPIRITSEVHPVALTPAANGEFVLDMGQNMTGWLRAKLRGPRGSEIKLHFGEMLDDKGNVYTANLRHPENQRLIITKGTDGEEQFVPAFTYQGFRYVQIVGMPQPPKLEDFVGLTVHSDAPSVGRFESSSPLLNKLMHAIHWTQQNNMHSVITDCPQRNERFGWLGDGQAFAQTSMYDRDMAAFYTKWLADIRDAQLPDGRFTEFAPRASFRNQSTWATGASGWADAGAILPWHIYRTYADRRLVGDQFESARRWIDFLEEKYPDRIKTSDKYGDWLNSQTTKLPGLPKVPEAVPKEVYATAFWAHSTDYVARMAAVLGRQQEAGRYRKLFEEIRSAFCKEFIDEQAQIKGDTQAGYALALHFRLLPNELRPKAVERLVEGIRRYDGHLSTGIQSTHRAMLALSQGGRHDEAWRLLNLHTVPSWGYMLDMGATTIWERWDGFVEGRGFAWPLMNSFDHPVFGSVGEWVWRNIVGLNPDETQPGYKHFIIHPRPAAQLDWVRASYESIRGQIRSEWEITDGNINLTVEVPAGTTATICVPTSNPGAVRENESLASEAQGVRLVREEPEAAVFEVESGLYRFTASQPVLPAVRP